MRRVTTQKVVLSLLTTFVLVLGVFAAVNNTSYSRTEQSDSEQLEIKQPSQLEAAEDQEEGTNEIGETSINGFEESGNAQEEQEVNDNKIIIEELGSEHENPTTSNDETMIEESENSEESTISYDETIDFEINAGEYEIIEDENGFHKINMLTLGYGVIDSPGDPSLPEKIFEFQVQHDIDWSSVELTVANQESKILPGLHNIAPNPPLWIGDSQSGYEDWGFDKSIVNGKNMRVYGRDANYPDDSIEMLSYTERKEPTDSGFENIKYVRMAFYPFLYNPQKQELTFMCKANVKIAYNCHPTPTPQPLGPTIYDYVIITTNDIVSNSDRLDNFINLKELTHDVLVVTEDDYDGLLGQPPNERPDKIRKWLIDNEGPMGIEFVLLIGDPDPDDPKDPDDHVGDLPMKFCWPNFLSWKCYTDAAYNGCPTDYYYADLTGNWDLDGDLLYGEGVDLTNDKSPDPSIGENTFSVEWSGQVMCDYSEDYKFHTFSDDGVELIIDGTSVINDWGTKDWPESNYVTQSMSAGKHDITLKYHEHTGHGIIKLYWETTSSDDVEKEIIPDDHLYDLADVVGGLDAIYYDNEDHTGTTFTRRDSTIDFFWGSGDMGAGGPDVGADVFVGRIPVYDDNYTQLDLILEKIIKYETDAGDISWRESALLTMAPLAENTPAYHYGEEVKNNILPPSWSYYRIYFDDYSAVGGPTPEDWPTSKTKVKTEWQNGYGLVTWWTHGSSGGADYIFDNSLTGDLDDTKPSIVFQSTCMNGYPENTNNLAYALLKHGTVATFASTRVSSGSRGNWTYDSTSTANPNFGYKTIDHLITDGFPTGIALYDAKDNVATVNMNGMNYNLYGDPDCFLLSTVPNAPPVADPGGPYIVDEGIPVTFDASGSHDPDGYPAPLEFRWDFDNDGEWDTGWSSSPTATYTWGDDYFGDVAVEVSDSVLTDTKATTITVNNLVPTIENIEAYILVNFTLRAAGEKWHNVEMYIYEDSTEIGYAEVVRYPGSPDDQSVTLVDVKCDVTKIVSVKVLYTPMDDPINGQPNGANPCWVNISFEDGGYNVTHHTFNVMHPDTWEWDIGVNQYFVGHEITFESTASDPGSDDLTFTWNWDDGTSDTVTIYYNDGMSPDPYPSPEGIYPISQFDEREHIFTANGNYNVELTVTDDDGDLDIIVVIIIIS